MTVTILSGDVRDVLATLPDDTFDCIVTSPPYWGLRDYGVAGQIGLEPTLTEYLDTMTAVCRDLRRVLKPKGTFWLNIGSCYSRDPKKGGSGPNGKHDTIPDYGAARRAMRNASDGKNPIPSRPLGHVPACDTGGIEPSGSHAPDCACRGLGGEYRGGSTSRHASTLRNGQPSGQSPQPGEPTGQGIEHQGSGSASGLSRQPPISASSPANGLDAADRATTASASMWPETSSADARGSERMPECTCGIAERGSASRTSGTDALARACNCGSCGRCFIYLATSALRLKPKDLVLVPDLLALALQADGWYVRSEIIWAKPNPMPESVTDRPTSSHEKVWLLTKSERYAYDADAVREPATEASISRLSQAGLDAQVGSTRANGGAKTNGNMKAVGSIDGRNLRNLWSIATQPFSGAHFATMPPDLVDRCIKAGCPKGGHVLDPFGGAGTTGLAADRLGRDATMIELNPAYIEIARNRIEEDSPLFAEVCA